MLRASPDAPLCIALHRIVAFLRLCYPVPPLGLFYLRSIAVVAGLELQVLVPSGPAPGPAPSCGPSPVSSAHALSFNKIHNPEQISSASASHLVRMSAKHAPSRHMALDLLSTSQRSAPQRVGFTRRRTKIQHCGRHRAAGRSTQQSRQSREHTGRRPSFRDPPWLRPGRLGNVTRGLACVQSHAASPQFHLA